MATQIKFPYKGVNYTLEYTRRSIEAMEKSGFVLSELSEKPVSVLPALFAGAFQAHHRYVKRELIDEIFSHMTNREELYGKLVAMYNEPIAALMENPAEDEGNIDWTANV